MIVPSIDILGGRAVQLRRGKDFVLDGGDPVQRLEEFSIAGEVAVVDLDAALGRGSNAELIRDLVRRAPCRVGGGIRDLDSARRWLDAGAVQIMIGTAATPEFCGALPRERVVAAVDANAARPAVSRRASGSGVTLFQPRCGIRTCDGSRRQRAAMRPSPVTPGVSSLASHNICMPRQMPRIGVPREAWSRMTASRPRDRSAAMPAPNAPTPGKTMRAAARTIAGSAETTTPALRRRNAPAIDARFATPESTIVTSLTARASERALGGRHVVESRHGDRLTQCQRGRLERGFGAVMVVVALQHVHVQGRPARRGERAQYMSDVLACEPANNLPAQAERDVGKWPAGEIDDRPSQPVVERCEGPAEPVYTTPLSQGPIERFSQCQGAIFSRVVIVHLQIAFAGQRHVEARVAGHRVEEMVEESDAGLDRRLAGAVEIERDANRCFACRAGHRRGPRAHGSSSSRPATRSRTRAAPASVNAAAVAVRSSPGATTPSGTTPAPAAARMSSGVLPTIHARRTPRRSSAR